MDQFWKQFKSGTDIRGVAAEGVPGQEINLTDEVIEKITAGFALWLADKLGRTDLSVSVGHDSRISASRIKNAVIRALSAAGIKVFDCGLSSTPAMFMSVLDLPCDGAVQITASHHPFNRNGLKFFTKDGGLNSEDIVTILEHASAGRAPAAGNGSCEKVDYMSQYAAKLRDLIKREVRAEEYDLPLKGYHIVVDAGNGAGGFYARDVLEPLGADITGSQFLEPDGMFPNHIPNPEDKEAMDSICLATVKHNADLGVIFDTDVDRGGAVDQNGREINRNRLVALASAIALEGNPGGTVVTDSITSSGLKIFIEEHLGGVHHRFKRGYKNVINEALRLNAEGVNCPLAIETSGHAAMRENYFLDDGAYLVTKIIIKMARLGKEGKKLEDLIADLAEPKEAVELRFPIKTADFRAYGEDLLGKLEAYAQDRPGWEIAPDNREGLRVSFGPKHGDGWFLLRLSVHDPIMPLNIESDSEGGTKIIAAALLEFLRNFADLDITALEKFCA